MDYCLTLLRGAADKTALLFRLNALNVPDGTIVVAVNVSNDDMKKIGNQSVCWDC